MREKKVNVVLLSLGGEQRGNALGNSLTALPWGPAPPALGMTMTVTQCRLVSCGQSTTS